MSLSDPSARRSGLLDHPVEDVQVVVSAIVTDGDRVLLLRRPPAADTLAMWELPGTGIEPSEVPVLDVLRDAVTRQTGLRLAEVTGYLRPFDTPTGPGRVTRQVVFVATVEAPGEVTLTEHDQYRWAGTDDLPFVSDEVYELVTGYLDQAERDAQSG